MTTQLGSNFLENKDNTSASIAPKQPHFGNCCCCSLRTGNLLLGWSYIVVSVLIIKMWIALLLISRTVNRLTQIHLVNAEILSSLERFIMPPTLMTIIPHILILVGVYKKRPNCLKAFVIITSICVIFSFILGVFEDTLSGFQPERTFFKTTCTLFKAVPIGLDILAIFIVNSYRIQLTNELAGCPHPCNLDV